MADILNWLSAILEDEARADINWHRVAALSEELKHSIDRGVFPDLPMCVNHFIDDWSARRADPVFGEIQRDKIKDWLSSIEPQKPGEFK